MMGWASAPYDPLWAHRYPKRAAIMAMAGPAGNLILALIAGVILRLGLNSGIYVPPAQPEFERLVEAEVFPFIFYPIVNVVQRLLYGFP